MAERRVALVIGNSAYQHVTPLTNPANDAAAMRDTFTKANFDVVDYLLDLKSTEMRRALRDFGDKARDADVAVIYFAGHGVEVDGSNYIIPVDAVLERDTDVYDEAFSLDRLLLAAESAKQLRLVILDACRDNPFAKTMRRTMASRSVGRGLARIEPASPNTLIAFAAKAGSIAAEGNGKNSPFTTALVKYLPMPGLDLRRAFGFVRDDVLKNTGNRQEPFVYGSLGGNDVALVPPLPAPSVAAAAPAIATGPGNNIAEMRQDYEFAERLGTRDGWSSFLAQYPAGFYAGLARAQLNKIAIEQQQRLGSSGSTAAESTLPDAGKAAADIGTASQPTDTGAGNPRQVAILPAPPPTPAQPEVSKDSEEIARSVQIELRRVGCSTSEADGAWNTTARRSLELFNKYAGTKLDTKLASIEAFEEVHSKTSRVCPLTCAQGFRADGDHCNKITCKTGYEVGDDNTCERKRPTRSVERPARSKHADQPERRARPAAATADVTRAGRQSSSPQVFCDYNGCRNPGRNCRIERGPFNPADGAGGLREVCN